jgi:hypothetical protein
MPDQVLRRERRPALVELSRCANDGHVQVWTVTRGGHVFRYLVAMAHLEVVASGDDIENRDKRGTRIVRVA